MSEIKEYKFEGNILEILKYPDPVLLKKGEEVTEFGKELTTLAMNMLFTLYHAPGVGLAAPQIGKSIRMFVADVDYRREKDDEDDEDSDYSYSNFRPRVFINPVITPLTEEKILYEEGCLSLPGVHEEIERYSKISVTYRNLRGETETLVATDLLAICIQHETDHLDGILMLDHMSLLKKNLHKKKLLKCRGKTGKSYE